jgi:NADH-quinone oxidoreductase subunit E
MPVFTPELAEIARRIVARYPEGQERSAILPLLYLAQSAEGHVSREGLREVAGMLGLTTAEVEGVATFYTMIRLRPTGRHVVSVCTNLACVLRGAEEVYARARDALGPGCEEVSEDGMFTLRREECLGACDAAPLVQVNSVNYDRVTPDRVVEIIDALRRGEPPTPSHGAFPGDLRRASRILAGPEAAGETSERPAGETSAGLEGETSERPAGEEEAR